MKVLFDTNVLISYLLTSEGEGTIATIIERGFAGDYDFVVPDEVITELRRKLTDKAWLAGRIPQSTAEKFITALREIAIIPPPITEPIPEVGRDVKDDYLFAYGTVTGWTAPLD
jgi:predicted nucleic acid-binding protein